MLDSARAVRRMSRGALEGGSQLAAFAAAAEQEGCTCEGPQGLNASLTVTDRAATVVVRDGRRAVVIIVIAIFHIIITISISVFIIFVIFVRI